MDDALYAPRDWHVQPPYLFEDYKSTVLRSPRKPLVPLPQTLSELTGPVYGHDAVKEGDDDLTRNAVVNGEPLGERIIVTGRVLDEDERPIPDTLVEVWQANAAGRYIHQVDQHDAPLDPNFLGAGRCATDAEGRYRFTTIRPGEYPWQNHDKAFRPAHIHFSLFGPSFVTRLVTQMYFPGDPLLEIDPIFLGIPDAEARTRLIAKFSLAETVSEWALGYEFDIVLRGRKATPREA
ncbi:MAG: protocatechuate 3,4-dioxygenase subunit beta [Alphaproteobacteria bacterium]|nr:protocatechuate 3,4-dioxygenase subunit beta [Alphaproteobacteria bacterium]